MQQAIDELKSGGADIAVAIAPSSIVTAAWTIMKCRYGCPEYGRNLCCPPFAPSWRETADIIACYDNAILFRVHDMIAFRHRPVPKMQCVQREARLLPPAI